MSYVQLYDVIFNKIDKATYDSYVASGAITQEMIDNQAWCFTDDQFVSATDIAKLNGIEAGAEANVINGLSVNGTLVNPTEGTKVVNIVVPTKTSDLTNDSNFITNAVDNLVNYYTKSESYTKEEVNTLIGNINTMNIAVVQALPTESISTNTMYLIAKADSATQNVYNEYLYINNAWELIGTTEVNLSNYALRTELPTKTSDLTNDSGYLTKATMPTISYNDLTDKPTGVAVTRIWSAD